MSEHMTPLPFSALIRQLKEEIPRHGTCFGVTKLHPVVSGPSYPLPFGILETPFGPAAGPNTQLAQNLAAAYVAGARFFELKTVQILDGPELSVCIPRPCIRTVDEGYNVEWSTELTCGQAQAEYVKGWFLLKILAKIYGFGDPNGFVFNMSVGYDLKGIQSEKVDSFIRGLQNAESLPIFRECQRVLLREFPEEAEFIRSISPNICQSVTLSTMHGCPAQEIEAIAAYLLQEKGLHTYVKCNPTLLGYEDVRQILDSMGYAYVSFDRSHFDADLQFADAIPMFRRLKREADSLGLCFGLKLSNTFPVQIRKNELPGEEMYMSGKSLFPLTIELSARIAGATGGQIPISYSGGADETNICALLEAGIFPITLCTPLLKPGGYGKFAILEKASSGQALGAISPGKLEAMSQTCRTDPHYQKGKVRPAPSKKPGFTCGGKACGTCVSLCPNRANVLLALPNGKKELLHLDAICNQCGCCHAFCPMGCAPSQDRVTLFASEDDMAESAAPGLCFRADGTVLIHIPPLVSGAECSALQETLSEITEALREKYPYYILP